MIYLNDVISLPSLNDNWDENAKTMFTNGNFEQKLKCLLT